MKTRHHKIPRSMGGSNNEQNIKIIEEWQHDLWHQAWGNRPPESVVKGLVALRKLFGDVKLSELELIIRIEWS
jgi:hypothetical protein